MGVRSLKPLDQFWWFFFSGLALGAVFVGSKRLFPGIIIHWIVPLLPSCQTASVG